MQNMADRCRCTNRCKFPGHNLEEVYFMKPGRVTLLDMLNDYNDFSEYAIEYEKERYEHEKELRWMARDYYNNLLSRSDYARLRQG